MKILFVIDTYDTNNNGTSISAQRFAAELRNRGHEVKILTAGEPGDDRFALPTYKMPIFQPLMDKHNFNFASNEKKTLMDKHNFNFASNEKKTIHEAVEWADIIHCFLPFAIEIEAKRYADKIGKSSTAAFHIQPQNLWSSVGLGKVDWIQNSTYIGFRDFLYNKFRHIHAPSQFMADEIKQRGYTAKIHVISNGIQDAFLKAGHRNIDEERPAKSPEFEGKILIMMVGRLSAEKRQDVLINAVPLSKYADKIQLVFAGQGPKHDEYVALGKALPHPPQFVYKNQEDLIAMLSQTDLYVHASDMESEACARQRHGERGHLVHRSFRHGFGARHCQLGSQCYASVRARRSQPFQGW